MSAARRGLELAALSAFALAQPLFDVLAPAPEFFVARGSTRWDVLTFALGVVVVAPALLLALETLVGAVSTRIRDLVHVVALGALAGLAALHALKSLGSPAALLGAAAIGVLFAAAYTRRAGVRLVVTALAPAPIVFLALFLNSDVGQLVRSGEAAAATTRASASAPVVMVIFDELPLVSLLDERSEIDAARYPNFRALAADATWFRRAAAINDGTLKAVPAVLTGNYPRKGGLPTASSHPRNLFSLLGGSYRLEVFEPVTRLCPESLCERDDPSFGARMRLLASDLGVVYGHVVFPDELAERLPPVNDAWMDFRGREAEAPERIEPSAFEEGLLRQLRSRNRHLQFAAFVASIESRDRQPTLYFLHSMLPHTRWMYLPSGHYYANANVPFALEGERWTEDRWLVVQARQRHLLQVEFVDRLLGTLLRRLRETGLYDRSLIVVTADHGMAFRPGDTPRNVSPLNVEELASVPLLVKTPGQRRGRVVDRTVETIDVLPTIAAALGVRMPWQTDGRSALNPRLDRRVVTIAESVEDRFTIERGEFATRLRAALARKLTDFPAGAYAIGPHRELLGRRVDDVGGLAPAGSQVVLDEPESYRGVDPSAPALPVYVTGRILGYGVRAGGGLPLAIAVNGRIAATTRTFLVPGSVRFAAMIQDSALHRGDNEVGVYRIR